MKEKINKINRLYATLSQVNQVIAIEQDKHKLFQEICNIVIEFGKFRFAWIGLVDEENKLVKPVAFSGEGAEYLQNLIISLAKDKTGRGPTGRSIREGKSIIFNDLTSNPDFAPWREQALEKGYRSSAAFPIRENNNVIGSLNIYAVETHFFDKEEIKLLEEVAKGISFALEKIKIEENRKQAQAAVRESQKRLNKILTNFPIGVSISTSEESVSYINRALWTIFGYDSGEDFLKVPASAHYYNPKDRDIFLEALKKGLVKDLEIRFKRKDGTMFWGSVCSTTLITRDGELEFINTFEDINERKHADQLLKALNQAAVSTGIAHTHQGIFNAVAEELKRLDISCILFPLDETQDRLITKFMSFESTALTMLEKLMGVTHRDFSIPIDSVDIFRKVVREKKAQYLEKIEQGMEQVFPKLSKKVLAQIIKSLRISKIILVPLVVEDRFIGIFSVQSDNLTQKDIMAITAFSHQLAGAWNKIKLIQDLQNTLEGTILTIAETVEARDPYTSGHQNRVADLAVSIATGMSLSKERVEGIRLAGIIHDLGKIKVPAEILSKPGKLSDLEFQIIQFHPQVGFDLLKNIEFTWPIAEIIHQHHERMDGSGYPQGLKGDEILLEARILAVADIVEAMSSHRPYRPALGIEKALTQIKNDKGTLLDPDAVDTCLKIFEQGYKLPDGKFTFNISAR